MWLQKYFDSVKVFMAFCDETRLRVLEHLQSGEKCAKALLEKISVRQSDLSYHMKVLVESGVVNAKKVGKWTYYSLSESGRQYAIELLKRLIAFPGNENHASMIPAQ